MKTASHLVDEILEAIWIARENDQSLISELVVDCPHDVDDLNVPQCLTELESEGFVRISGENVSLTEPGEDRARNIIRDRKSVV